MKCNSFFFFSRLRHGLFALGATLVLAPAGLAWAAVPVMDSASPGTGLDIAGGDGITVAGSGFVQSGGVPFTQISIGLSASTCGIGSDGLAYCWGYNNSGQLGNNSTSSSSVPVAVDTSGVFSGLTIKQISVGSSHACAIASDDKAYCWGSNAYGQLGNNSSTNSSVPVAVDTSGVLNGLTIKQISSSNQQTCAIASNDKAYCWGYNGSGQLGNNSTTNSPIPVAVNTSGVFAGLTIKQISMGEWHTCAIASNDKAYCWGNNQYGQLGNNSTADSLVPVAVNTSGVLSGLTIKQISVGGFSTCVIASDDKAYCWGANGNGELGNNSTTSISSIPVAVDTSGVLSGLTVKQISSGEFATCVIASDGKAYCWGYNFYGQLGNNSTTNSPVPVAVNTSGVLSGLTVKQVAVIGDHVCAIASNYRMYCWGINYAGALGNDSATDSPVPVAVIAPFTPAITPIVTVGGVAAADMVVVSDTKITFTAPPHAPGVYDLVLDYGGGLTVTRPNALTYIGVIDSATLGIAAPAKNATPATAATGCGPDFACGNVQWSPPIGPSGKFLGGTEYTATVVLTANPYYTFTGGLTTHTINAANAAVTNNTGATATLSYKFTATAAPVVADVAVTTPPNLSYIDGQTFSLEGMVVTVTYDDGSTKTIATDYAAAGITSTSPVDGSVLRTAQNGDPVTINYDDGVTSRSGMPAGVLKVTLQQTSSSATPVPALGEWALAALALMLAGAALRRRV